MQRYLVATASAIAILLGTTFAMAQTKDAPSAKDPSAGTSSGMTSPGAAGSATGTSTGMSGSSFKSYEKNKEAMAGASASGGHTADELLGAQIVNAQGDEIGEIEDLLIDQDNKISKAIVEVGGFLGIGSKFVPVDIAKLKKGANQQGFVSDMTKEQLKALPEYEEEGGNWMLKTSAEATPRPKRSN